MIPYIHFQLAALFITIVVIFMSKGHRRLNFSAERSFYKLVICVLISEILDVSSVFAIKNASFVGNGIVQLVCELYLQSIVLVGCYAAWFAVAELRYSFQRFWVRATILPFAANVIVSLFFETKVYIDDRVVYSYGIPVIFTFAMGFVYLIACIVMLIVLKKQIPERRRKSLLFWIVSWFVAAVIQFLFSELLIASFAMAVACLFMYCKLENSEYHLEFFDDVFSRKGFYLLMTEQMEAKEDYSLVNINLDSLGSISEIFGKDTVDTVITEICSFIADVPETKLFRLDGSLFTVLIKDNRLMPTVDAIKERMELPWEVKRVQVFINSTITYISKPYRFKDVEKLEDVIVYFTKEKVELKGTTFHIDDEALCKRDEILGMQHALDWAMRNETVDVYFQPIYSVREHRFSSMEALARIRDEEGELILPAAFIEYAEENGMILKLGNMIFKKVCEFISQMHIEDYGIDYVEVNLSAVQCMQTNIAEGFQKIMNEYGVNPNQVHFEIAETSIATPNAFKYVKKTIEAFTTMGSAFSLDNYGTGSINLIHLADLPFKLIKFDPTLTGAFLDSNKGPSIAQAYVDMIHNIGMEVVVNGVENEDRYKRFEQLGAEYIQGFCFSQPLAKERVLGFFKEWMKKNSDDCKK